MNHLLAIMLLQGRLVQYRRLAPPGMELSLWPVLEGTAVRGEDVLRVMIHPTHKVLEVPMRDQQYWKGLRNLVPHSEALSLPQFEIDPPVLQDLQEERSHTLRWLPHLWLQRGYLMFRALESKLASVEPAWRCHFFVNQAHQLAIRYFLIT